MFWLVRLASIALGIGACFLIDLVAMQQTAIPPRLFALAGLYVTLAVSLNLINGITGQFSLGHAAFYQVGAYVAGYLTATFFKAAPLAGPAWLMAVTIAGAVGAALAGLLVGLPSLRLRGDYLAIVTLGFGEIIRIIVQNQDKLGGSYGLNINPKIQSIWLVWLLAFVCIAACRNLLRSPRGLTFLAVREDEIASSAMGVHVTRTKVTAFVIGSAFAGAAGSLYAHYEGFISPQTFPMDLSFILVTMVVLGGLGSITGSVIAALLLFGLPEYLRRDDLVFSGASLVGIALGIVSAVVAARWVAANVHGPWPRRWGAGIGAWLGAGALAWLVGLLLTSVPVLASAHIKGEQLRLVIFAVVLIVLMLLRPQGVLAHHELSWDMLRRWSRKGKEAAA